MTEYQESQIRGLRMRGAGYKAIASDRPWGPRLSTETPGSDLPS